MGKKCDFEGWVAKYGVLCSDNTIMHAGAFAKQNGTKVPLVYQHNHKDINAVIGHSYLYERPEGVWAESFLNGSADAQAAAECIKHGDLDSYSIFANGLQRAGNNIMHGTIREVSVVLSGADPTARIEHTYFAHADGIDGEELLTEGVCYFGEKIIVHDATEEDGPEEGTKEEEKSMADETKGTIQHADGEAATNTRTAQDVIDTFNEEQKEVYDFMLEQAIAYGMEQASKQEPVEHDGTEDGDYIEHSEGGNEMNVFENYTNNGMAQDPNIIAHGAEVEAKALDMLSRGSFGNSFHDAIEHAATEYGIENIDWLFPDAKTLSNRPELIQRNTGWVDSFMSKTKHIPFSRVKSVFADLTAEEAKAKGYIKGNRKIEGYMTLAKRVTEPQTVYVKRKIDNDDVLDITDFDVLALIQADMKPQLNEALAVAALVGDGRSAASDDKIKEDRIRPIWTDEDLFVINVVVSLTGSETIEERNAKIEEAVLRARKDYKGSGSMTFYTTEDILTDWRLMKDGIGHKIYKTDNEVAQALRCSDIQTAEQLQNKTRTVVVNNKAETRTLYGIMVNPIDYGFGTNQGGQIKGFNGFDIDYNQHKFLQETRTSGALIKAYCAIVIETVAAG
jgi:HK97 family phage prohead protease